MTVRLHLIVPGTTPAGRRAVVGAGDGLDEPGRQAVLRLTRRWPTGVVASCAPELACVETAALLGLNAMVDMRVRDWDLGAWTGRSLTTIATTSPQDLQYWLEDPDFAEHGGESLQALQSRVSQWLDALETDRQPRLVTVAPAAVARAALVNVLSAPPSTFWRLDLEPLASVHISLREGRRAVRWPAGDTHG
jgi:broad specificity phosphatase PhoE